MTACSLVTGASEGIGAAIAGALAAAGHRVAVHAGRDLAAAERVCAALLRSGHLVIGIGPPPTCASVSFKKARSELHHLCT
jgi:NAD(P)-dependent dehydrogenase (short-subunit alcohol dehydrogenase family)